MTKIDKEMSEINEFIRRLKDPNYVPEYTLDMMREVIVANASMESINAIHVICSELNYRPALLQEDAGGIIKATLYEVAKGWELVAHAIKEIADKLPDELPDELLTIEESADEE